MTNIVILTRNRKALYRQCIESLHAHTDPSAYTCVVVDDGSDEPVQVGPLQNVSVLRVARSGHVLSQLKNLGVYWSEQRFGRGDWLYMGDSDTYFMEGWLPKLISAAELAEAFGYRLFGGQVHPYHRETDEGYCALDGPSWLMRWSTWDQFGPLDRTTAPGPCKGEDGVFSQKIRDAGFKLGAIRPHVVAHCGITNTEGVPVPGAEHLLERRIAGVFYE